MAKPPYLEEGYMNMKHYTPKKDQYTPKARSLSFFASIFSLLIYISIFYIFNLSPYTLFNNNIFWFFMSNTLILIIAADYGAFSSSKKKQQDNIYEEYEKHSQQRNYYVSSSYDVPKYHDQQVDHKQCIISSPKQNNSEMIIPHERVLEIVVQNEPKKGSDEKKEVVVPLQVEFYGNKKELDEKKKEIIPPRIYRRSKSERSHHRGNYKRAVIDERVNMMRSQSEKEEEKLVELEDNINNEFDMMTNEDLNRRVEEFIQKFNRQIRLQATRN